MEVCGGTGRGTYGEGVQASKSGKSPHSRQLFQCERDLLPVSGTQQPGITIRAPTISRGQTDHSREPPSISYYPKTHQNPHSPSAIPSPLPSVFVFPNAAYPSHLAAFGVQLISCYV